jgi:hypothetical protein
MSVEAMDLEGHSAAYYANEASGNPAALGVCWQHLAALCSDKHECLRPMLTNFTQYDLNSLSRQDTPSSVARNMKKYWDTRLDSASCLCEEFCRRSCARSR